MRGFINLIDGLNGRLGRAVTWLILASVFVSAVNAVLRKAFAFSSNAALEAQWYLSATTVMLGAAWVLQENGHVRIELLASRFNEKVRRRIELFGHVLMLVPMAAMMTWLSLPFFVRSLRQNEGSLNAGGLLVWPMRGIIVLGFALLLLQGISEIFHLVLGDPLPETRDARDDRASDLPLE